MQDVYLIGHGFMDSNDTIELSVPMHTYISEGNMLDGRKIAAIVERGPSGYIIDSANEEWRANAPGRTINEHYLCGDLASYNDVNKTQKWSNKIARVGVTSGILFTLPGGDYLFFTRPSQAVRLSGIIDSLIPRLGVNFQVHWTACRSLITGANDGLKLAEINGGDLVNAISLA
ncbi:MAG: hypothetical protein ACI978_000987 [Oleispira sp.]|jgi:hypothetical protein